VYRLLDLEIVFVATALCMVPCRMLYRRACGRFVVSKLRAPSQFSKGFNTGLKSHKLHSVSRYIWKKALFPSPFSFTGDPVACLRVMPACFGAGFFRDFYLCNTWASTCIADGVLVSASSHLTQCSRLSDIIAQVSFQDVVCK
jgi:hypothetical protein